MTGITTGPRAEAHARAKRARKEIRPTLPSLETGAETATSAKPILECHTIDSAAVGRPPNRFRIVGKFEDLDSSIFLRLFIFRLLLIKIKILKMVIDKFSSSSRGHKGSLIPSLTCSDNNKICNVSG